jgi:predicted ester cyclase
MKKKLAFLPFILCLLVSCQNKQSTIELEELKSQGNLEEQNKDYVRNYFIELGKTRSDDLAEFVEKYVSPNFILHLPGEEVRGREGLEKHYANSMAAFPDAVQTIQDVLAQGDKVAFRGVLMIVLPNTKEINVTFVGFWNIQNGKIVEWWSEYDALGMMQQLRMELQQKDSS